MSRWEMNIDVWKYFRPILMGLGAVLEEKLDNQDRALRPYTFYVPLHWEIRKWDSKKSDLDFPKSTKVLSLWV